MVGGGGEVDRVGGGREGPRGNRFPSLLNEADVDEMFDEVMMMKQH